MSPDICHPCPFTRLFIYLFIENFDFVGHMLTTTFTWFNGFSLLLSSVRLLSGLFMNPVFHLWNAMLQSVLCQLVKRWARSRAKCWVEKSGNINRLSRTLSVPLQIQPQSRVSGRMFANVRFPVVISVQYSVASFSLRTLISAERHLEVRSTRSSTLSVSGERDRGRTLIPCPQWMRRKRRDASDATKSSSIALFSVGMS